MVYDGKKGTYIVNSPPKKEPVVKNRHGRESRCVLMKIDSGTSETWPIGTLPQLKGWRPRSINMPHPRTPYSRTYC